MHRLHEVGVIQIYNVQHTKLAHLHLTSPLPQLGIRRVLIKATILSKMTWWVIQSEPFRTEYPTACFVSKPCLWQLNNVLFERLKEHINIGGFCSIAADLYCFYSNPFGVTAKCNPRDISKSWGVQIDNDLHHQQDIQPPLEAIDGLLRLHELDKEPLLIKGGSLVSKHAVKALGYTVGEPVATDLQITPGFPLCDQAASWSQLLSVTPAKDVRIKKNRRYQAGSLDIKSFSEQ